MNRIIIIGNGFDLAQGLKTSYEDFLVDFLKEEIRSVIALKQTTNRKFFDLLIPHIQISRFDEIFDPIRTINHFLSVVEYIEKPRYTVDYNEAIIHLKSSRFSMKSKSLIFESILSNKNWTDIEKVYFDCLIEIVEKSDKQNFQEQISKLNSDFEYLKKKLIEYLKKVDKDEPNVTFNSILEELLEKPNVEYLKRFFQLNDSEYEEFELSKVVFLNFNYTSNLIKFYGANSNKIQYIPIHGNISRPESIIFGYGDDSNEHYKALENYDMKELLEYIKSFYYPSQKHYIDLMNIIDSDVFDVIVLGHSLGLSDRVLLESIFEHENCKAIRLYHRGKKSHFEKLIALSRHFKDKQSMRRKIVEYNQHDVLGQAKAD